MKPKYVSNDLHDPVHNNADPAQIAARLDEERVKRRVQTSDASLSAVGRIEKSFEYAQQPPVHATKKHLRPVSVTPLLPDFPHWMNSYFSVAFDSNPDPALDGVQPAASGSESAAVSKSLLMRDAQGTGSISYYLAGEGQQAAEEEQGDTGTQLQFVRTYSERVVKWDNMFMLQWNSSVHPGSGSAIATYCPLDSRMKLTRKRASAKDKAAQTPSEVRSKRKQGVLLRTEPLDENDEEERLHKRRMLLEEHF
jgi:hypothetical protein